MIVNPHAGPHGFCTPFPCNALIEAVSFMTLLLLAIFPSAAVAQRPPPHRGHEAPVNCLAFAPTGGVLASGSADKTIRLWRVASASEMGILSGHTDEVLSVVFSPDGRTLASAGKDRHVKLWNVLTRRETMTLPAHTGWVRCVAFSPSGKTLVSGDHDGSVLFWDVATGKRTTTLQQHAGAITSVALAPDGNMLASASSDHTIRLWDLATEKSLALRPKHLKTVRCVAFSPDGKTLVSVGDDAAVKVWDTASAHELKALPGHSSYVLSAAFNMDGRILATAGEDRLVRIWELPSGDLRSNLKGHGSAVRAVAFCPCSNVLVTASDDKSVRFWDAETGHERTDFPAPDSFDLWADELSNFVGAVPTPVLDAQTMPILIGALLGITIVMLMRSRMTKYYCLPSRAVLLYKIWHFPVFIVGNSLKPRFILITVGMCVCAVLAVVGVTLGYALGARLGTVPSFVGAVIGLFVAWLASEKILAGVLNDPYCSLLRQDMFSGSPAVLTINPTFVFPILCVVQSATLLGLVGSLVGDHLSHHRVGRVPLAVISAFFGLFIAQCIACLKREQTSKPSKIALSLVQCIAVGVLLLPGKTLMADKGFLTEAFAQLSKALGGDLGVNAAFVGVAGIMTHYLASLVKSSS